MRKNKKKILSMLLIVLSVISITLNAYAHSGRTDSSGGHKDNKNKSGLGSYHYHCGGNPPHLHENGVCPYSSNSTSSNNSTSNSSTFETSTPNTVTSNTETMEPATIVASAIRINETVEEMEIGESHQLTVTIEPSNVTEKNITWKSSNDSIATISATGEVLAIKAGVVDIIASTSNGKTSTIQINVEEPIVIPVSTNTDNTSNDVVTDESNNSDPLSTLLGMGLLGGGAYWGYKKYKK